MCVRVVAARLLQKLTSTFFEKKILHFAGPFGAAPMFDFFNKKTLILAFEANSAASLNCTFFGF